MQSTAVASPGRVVILATGGTIAGTAAAATDSLGYRAAQLGIDALAAAVPPLAGLPLEAEQIAQIDSKDMDAEVWRRLAARIANHLARPEVAGIVVTHGTDTMEETAYLLQRVLAPAKPVVLTGAMRPATALVADGPQNLLDAVTVARTPGAAGVCVVFAGLVYGAGEVRKVHTQALAAFGADEAGPLARLVDGRLLPWRAWPAGAPLGLAVLDGRWPWVEIVTSHADARGELVDLLAAHGVEGIVVAATGNGTVHRALEAALQRAEARGIAVRRSTRVASGAVHAPPGASWTDTGALTPAQARIALALALRVAALSGSSGG